MKKNFTSTVAGASILLTGVGLLSRGLGLIREVVFAGSFGLGEEFDIYLVGAVLPMTIQIVILFLIQNYLIPSYNDVVVKSPEQKEDFIRTNFWIFSLAATGLAVVLYLCSPYIIKLYLPATSSAGQEEAKQIFNLFLLTIPVSASSSVLIAYLQNKLDFVTPSFARLTINIAVIILVFLLSGSYGTVIIPIGFFIGGLSQFFILFYKTDIKLFTSLNRLINRHHFKNSLTMNLVLIIIIETLSQLYAVADRYFISTVEPGGIAALNYAQTLFVLPIVTISLALSTALFPKLSQDYSSQSHDDLEKRFYSGIRINLLVFIPIMFLFIFFGDEIIRIIYERGKFSASDTIMTAQTLKYFSISLVFYAIYSILNKMIYSAKWIKILLLITVAGILIKIILNILLVKSFSQNGLAFSTAISYIFFFIASFIVVDRKLSLKITSLITKELIFHSVSAVVSFVVVISLLKSFEFNLILYSIILPVSFCIVYFVNLWIIKSKSISLILVLLPKSELRHKKFS